MFAFLLFSTTVAKGLCYEVVWTQNIVVFRDCLGSKLGNDGYTLLSALSVSKAIQFHNFVERLSTTKSPQLTAKGEESIERGGTTQTINANQNKAAFLMQHSPLF